MKGVDELTELLAELAADADEALKYDALAEERRRRIRQNLPRAYEAGAGFVQLERAIKSIYVARTISRWVTSPPAPDKPRGKRKRAGAAPNGS